MNHEILVKVPRFTTQCYTAAVWGKCEKAYMGDAEKVVLRREMLFIDKSRLSSVTSS